MRALPVLLALAIAPLFAPSRLAAQAPAFTSVGMGGGGAMYEPVCSPLDHTLMFVACDMGGVYRSTDGGKNWRMLDKRQLRDANGCRITFDPKNVARLYAASGTRLARSEDRGEHWQDVVSGAPPWEKAGAIAALAVDPQNTAQLFVGTANGAWANADGDKTWTKCGASGAVVGFAFDERPNKKAVFAGTKQGVYRSDDGGANWHEVSAGLPSRELRAFAGGSDPATGQAALYCTLSGTAVDGHYAGGVYVSLDRGDTWQSAMGSGINTELGKKDEYGIDPIPQYEYIGMSRGLPGTAYVTTRGTGYHPPYHWTVFRTDDFGKTWRHCYTGDPREKLRNVELGWVAADTNWGFGGPANGFSVCENDPRIAMFTNNAELFVTHDGAASWQVAYGRRADPEGEAKAGQAWESCGLEVTSCWHFDFDPHDARRAYICYTDIGFARSEDGGVSWRHGTHGSPWANSFYQIVFDPERSGVIYAACSNQHDIPTWTNVDKPREHGGVCLSKDYGATWAPLNKGLPEAPVTGLALDPKSPAEARILYAAVFGHGVFKSEDGGATWREMSKGLGTESNRHVYAIKFDAQGNLYCSVTGKRDGRAFAEGSGLYRSTDGGANWALVSLPLHWAGDFAFAPDDPKVIYLAAASAPAHDEGGLYKTVDAGAHWRRVIKDQDLPQELSTYIQGFFVTVDPRHPSRVLYSAQTHGLFVSDDAGGKWREVPGIPFKAINRVTFDPVDPDLIWVTTFGGGVWKGKLSSPSAAH